MEFDTGRHIIEIQPDEIAAAMLGEFDDYEPGVGDWLARCLRRIGITSRRYMRLKQWLGLAPRCSCVSRVRWLNRLFRRKYTRNSDS